MAIPAKLQTKIEHFLSVRVKSSGGYAPVMKDEVEQLSEIVSGLIDAKYQADPDGDRPINFKLIDRTRYEPDHYFPIPSTARAKTWVDYLDPLDLAMTNVKIAADRADILTRCMKGQRQQELFHSTKK